MKPRKFFWRWNDGREALDTEMNRRLAARLLRAWRANPDYTVARVVEPGALAFRVVRRGYDLTATMIVRAA